MGKLRKAAESGSVPAAIAALNASPRLDPSTPLGDNGETALHVAVRGCHSLLVRALRARGADAHLPNTAGVSPLGLAQASGNLGMVRMLARRAAFASEAHHNATLPNDRSRALLRDPGTGDWRTAYYTFLGFTLCVFRDDQTHEAELIASVAPGDVEFLWEPHVDVTEGSTPDGGEGSGARPTAAAARAVATRAVAGGSNDGSSAAAGSRRSRRKESLTTPLLPFSRVSFAGHVLGFPTEAAERSFVRALGQASDHHRHVFGEPNANPVGLSQHGRAFPPVVPAEAPAGASAADSPSTESQPRSGRRRVKADSLREVLAASADVEYRAALGKVAAKLSRVSTVPWASKLSALIHTTPLTLAASKGDAQTVSNLLFQGKCEADDIDANGRNALLCGAWSGSCGVIEAVMAAAAYHGQRAEVDTTDSFGNTPLIAAARKGYVDAVALLLQHKANVHAQVCARVCLFVCVCVCVCV